MCAFVPVAPVSTNKVTREEYESVSVPTLIVVGEKDTGLGRTSAKHLSQIPSASQVQVGSNFSDAKQSYGTGTGKKMGPRFRDPVSRASILCHFPSWAIFRALF